MAALKFKVKVSDSDRLNRAQRKYTLVVLKKLKSKLDRRYAKKTFGSGSLLEAIFDVEDLIKQLQTKAVK